MKYLHSITLYALALVALCVAIAGKFAPALGRAGARFLEPWAFELGGLGALYAVVNTKSTIVTNLDATPPVECNSRIHKGRLVEDIAIVEMAAADDNDSVYRMVRVNSNDRISSVEVASDAITGASDVNVGLYDIAANGGAVVNENLFGDAVDLSSAIAFTDVTYETTPTNKDKAEKMVWELLGLSSDPGKQYDVCLKAVAAASTAGTAALRLRRVVGN